MKKKTNQWRYPLLLGTYALITLLALNCGVSFNLSTIFEMPDVVTQEVTRMVVATPTTSLANSPEPISTAISPEATQATPSLPSATITPAISSSSIEDELSDPASTLDVLSVIADDLLSQGIHTLRLTVDLEVPMEAVIRNGQEVDENLTRLVGNQLAEYEIGGDLVVDISLDDLSQQRWVIKAMGGMNGMETEQIVEIWQDGSTLWERPVGEEWVQRDLPADEAMIPLANSLVTIDNYSHAVNLSGILVDILRPLLLVRGVESPSFQEYGWALVDGTSTGVFIQAGRERALSSSNNMMAIVASLANSGISRYVSPADFTNGIQEFSSHETAWLSPDSWLVDHSLVEIFGSGTVELSYQGQARTMDGTITLQTESIYEYLRLTTNVLPPAQ